MYVKNLRPDVTEEKFKEVMSKSGEVVSVVLKPFKGFRNQGEVISQFGFVNYKTNEEAMNLMRNQMTD